MPRYELVRIPTSPCWYIQWFEAGRSRRASTRTADRAQAENVLAAFKLVRSERPALDPTLPLILDWYADTRGKELARLDSAELAIRHLKAFFGSSLVADVNLEMQEQYQTHRRGQGVGDETVRRELSVLSAATRRAVQRQKLTAAPPMLSIPKAAARERWLTRNEAAKLLRSMRSERRARHLVLFTRLALYTGARSGAILDLTWDRVDLERGMIWYPLPGRQQATKRRAVVPVEANVLRALKATHRRKVGDYVIQWRGEKCDRIVRAFVRHAKACGFVGVTPHTLRHTFATWAAMKGVPLFLIGSAIGQSQVATTARYAKFQPDALREVTRAVRRK